ncbi:MAG TPA: hypothetical protein VKI44_09525 [Acetobacteraceae bacterium]|nr:hypothetical protein [Acetobacteraceae bacterium]
MRVIPSRIAATIAIALLPLIALLSVAASAQSTLSGVYKGNGKPAALTQVTAHKGDPESGQPVTVLVFTTKDQAKDPKAGFNALFGKFGDALVVKVFPDGKIYSIDLIHSKLDSPSGSIQVFGVGTMKDFTMAGGEISGHLTSGGAKNVRDQTWEVDLIFKTKAP